LVGPGSSDVQGADGDLGARDAAEQRLQVLPRGGLPGAVKGPAVKVLEDEVARLRLHVHAGGRQVAAGAQLFGVGKVYLSGVAREFRLRARKLEAAQLAHCAPATIAAHQPPAWQRVLASLHRHAIRGLLEVRDGQPIPDSDSQGSSAARQHRFEPGQLRDYLHRGRARQAIRPLGGLHIILAKLDAGEVAARPGFCTWASRQQLGQRRHHQLLEQPPAVKRFHRKRI
jgi:hypothetical protein